MSLLNAQRRDGNEREIIDTARKAGAVVIQMDKSAGFDLLVILRGIINAVEVKKPGEKLTERETKIAELFSSAGAPFYVVHSGEELLDALGLW